jgi:hypothetical protein
MVKTALTFRLGHYPKPGKIDRVPDPSKYRVQKLLRYELGYNDVVFTSGPHQVNN